MNGVTDNMNTSATTLRTINIRGDVHAKIKALAKSERRTLAGTVEILLESYQPRGPLKRPRKQLAA
jgi:hypothetical protein